MFNITRIQKTAMRIYKQHIFRTHMFVFVATAKLVSIGYRTRKGSLHMLEALDRLERGSTHRSLADALNDGMG